MARGCVTVLPEINLKIIIPNVEVSRDNQQVVVGMHNELTSIGGYMVVQNSTAAAGCDMHGTVRSPSFQLAATIMSSHA